MVLPDSEVLPVNLARMVAKETQDHVVSVVKLVPRVFQELRVRMAKMAHPENLVRMESQAPQEKGVNLDLEDLLDLMAFQEKRVLVGSAVVQAPQGPEELLENLAEMASLEVQDRGVCPEAQEDQAMMENQGLPEVKEKVVVQVLQAHLVPGVSLVSWASLVLKEMMELLAKMENEVALEVLALRVLLERMVKLDLRVPQALPGQGVTKEMQDLLVHKDYKAYLEPLGLQEKMENLVKQAQRVRLVHPELQEARVTLVPPGNEDLPDQSGLQDPGVTLAPLVPKEERVLLVPLGQLVLLVLLVCKGCLENGEVLEVPAQRVTRVSQDLQVLMGLPGKMDPGVLLVPLVPLAQLVSLETRAKVVALELQV